MRNPSLKGEIAMSNSVTSLNNPTRLADSSKLAFQVTVLQKDKNTGKLNAFDWTFSYTVEVSEQDAMFEAVQRKSNEQIAWQVLQYFEGADIDSIADMVLVHVAGNTADKKPKVAFAMIRLHNRGVWMVSNTEAGNVILAQEHNLYYDIRSEMIHEEVAKKTDRFEQVRR